MTLASSLRSSGVASGHLLPLKKKRVLILILKQAPRGLTKQAASSKMLSSRALSSLQKKRKQTGNGANVQPWSSRSPARAGPGATAWFFEARLSSCAAPSHHPMGNWGRRCTRGQRRGTICGGTRAVLGLPLSFPSRGRAGTGGAPGPGTPLQSRNAPEAPGARSRRALGKSHRCGKAAWKLWPLLK